MVASRRSTHIRFWAHCDRLVELVDVGDVADLVVGRHLAAQVVAELVLGRLAHPDHVRAHARQRGDEAPLVLREGRLHEDDVHLRHCSEGQAVDGAVEVVTRSGEPRPLRGFRDRPAARLLNQPDLRACQDAMPAREVRSSLRSTWLTWFSTVRSERRQPAGDGGVAQAVGDQCAISASRRVSGLLVGRTVASRASSGAMPSRVGQRAGAGGRRRVAERAQLGEDDGLDGCRVHGLARTQRGRQVRAGKRRCRRTSRPGGRARGRPDRRTACAASPMACSPEYGASWS